MVSHGGRRRALAVLTLATAVAGTAVLVAFWIVQDNPPTATSAGGGDGASAVPPATPSSPTDRAGQQPEPGRKQAKTEGADNADTPLPASKPTSISIPAIDVGSEVISIGKNPDGTLAVPTGKNIDKAAWYQNSPTPGQTGPSVIEGHIDTEEGPSVFYRLAALESGNTIKVTRADDTQVEFTVTDVRAYPTKDQFPTRLVYGGDLSKPSLRLVTCTNFDQNTQDYTGNTVVYAKLTNVTK